MQRRLCRWPPLQQQEACKESAYNRKFACNSMEGAAMRFFDALRYLGPSFVHALQRLGTLRAPFQILASLGIRMKCCLCANWSHSCLFIKMSHIGWSSLQLFFFSLSTLRFCPVGQLWPFDLFLLSRELCTKAGSAKISPLWHHTATSRVKKRLLWQAGGQNWFFFSCCKHRANTMKWFS